MLLAEHSVEQSMGGILTCSRTYHGLSGVLGESSEDEQRNVCTLPEDMNSAIGSLPSKLWSGPMVEQVMGVSNTWFAPLCMVDAAVRSALSHIAAGADATEAVASTAPMSPPGLAEIVVADATRETTPHDAGAAEVALDTRILVAAATGTGLVGMVETAEAEVGEVETDALLWSSATARASSHSAYGVSSKKCVGVHSSPSGIVMVV